MSKNPIIEKPRTRIPSTETEQRAAALIAEVRDLFEQYKREVPRKRKPWPESIKKRILGLWALGVGSHQIALEAGVPVQTLYSWRQRIKKEGFTELAVRSPRRTGFQIRMDEDRRSGNLQLSQLESMPTTQTSNLAVVLPGGIRLEGLSLEEAIAAARRFS